MLAGTVFFCGSITTLAIATPPSASGPAVSAPLVRPGTLNLQVGDVDLATLPNLLATDESWAAFIGVKANGEQPPIVLEFDSPNSRARSNALRAIGARAHTYLPTNCFLADVPAGTSRDQLINAGVLRAVRWDNAWKVSPTINTATARTGNRSVVNLCLFAFRDAARTLAELRQSLKGEEVLHTSTTFSDSLVLTVELPTGAIAGLQELTDLQFAEATPTFTERSNATTQWVIQSNVTNVTPFYSRGITGSGQLVGIIDGPVASSHCAFSDDVEIGPDHRKILAYNAPQGVNFHGTHVACTAVGDAGPTGDPNLRGIAYGARMVFNTWPSQTEESVFDRFALHSSQGAKIHSNSWGTDLTTAYDGTCRAIDSLTFADDSNLIVFSISNATSIRNPENSKNCLAVGATRNAPSQNTMYSTAVGPTSDGRRKPDVVAPGFQVVSASGTSCATGASSGTSMATPSVSGAAVLLRSYFTKGFYPTGEEIPANGFEPSGALLKALVVNSAQDITSTADWPSTREGWGRPLLENVAYFSGDARKLVVRQRRNAVSNAIETGGTVDTAISVLAPGSGQSTEPLRVTLAWFDAPAAAGVSFAPVNDLDLEVVAPDGTLYRSNTIVNGASVAGAAADPINNVEQVVVLSPTPGAWTVRVVGTAIQVSRQGYGLAVTGNVSANTEGYSCDSLDFNGDGNIEPTDVDAYFSVLGGGSCIPFNFDCNDTDFNNDGTSDPRDIDAYFSVLGEGPCF